MVFVAPYLSRLQVRQNFEASRDAVAKCVKILRHLATPSQSVSRF